MPNEAIQYDAKLNLTSLENDLKAAEQRVSQFFAKLEKRLTQPIKLKIDTSDVDKKLTAIEKRFERLSRQSIHVTGGSTLANGTPVRTAQSYLPVAQSTPMLGMSPATVAATSLLPALMVNNSVKSLGRQMAGLSMGGGMSPGVRQAVGRAAAAATFMSHPEETKAWYQSEQRKRGIQPGLAPTAPFSGPYMVSALSGGAIPTPDVNEPDWTWGKGSPHDTMRGVPWAALHLGPRNPRPRAGWWSNQRRAWGVRAGKFRRWLGQTPHGRVAGMFDSMAQGMGLGGLAGMGVTNGMVLAGGTALGVVAAGSIFNNYQNNAAAQHSFRVRNQFTMSQPGATLAQVDPEALWNSTKTPYRNFLEQIPLGKTVLNVAEGLYGMGGGYTHADFTRMVADKSVEELQMQRRLDHNTALRTSEINTRVLKAQNNLLGTDDKYQQILATAKFQQAQVQATIDARTLAAIRDPVKNPFTPEEEAQYKEQIKVIGQQAQQDFKQQKAADLATHQDRMGYLNHVLSNPFAAQEDQIRQKYSQRLSNPQNTTVYRQAQQEMAAELGTHRQLFNRQMADTSAQLRTVGLSSVFAARQAAGGYSFAAAQTQLQGQIQLVRYQDAQVNARYAQPAQRQNLHNQYAQQIATLAAQLQQNNFNNQTSRLSIAGQLGQNFATLGDNPFVAQLMGVRTQAALDARNNPQNAGLINQNLSVQERVLAQQFGRSDYQQRRLTGSINSSARSLELRMRGDFGSAQLQDIQDNITRQINLVDPSLPQDIQQKRIAAIKNLGQKQIEALERQYAGGYGSSYNIGAFTSTNIPSAYPLTKEQKKEGVKKQTLDLDQFFKDLPGVQAAIENATNSGYTGAKRKIPETPGGPLTPSGGQATDKIVGLLTRIATSIDQFVSGGFVAGP